MHGMTKSVMELHGMLKNAEENIKKTSPVLMVQKGIKKKVKGKGKAKAKPMGPNPMGVHLHLPRPTCWVSHAINHINFKRKTRETYKDRIAYSIIN